MHNKIGRLRLYFILIAVFFIQLTVLDYFKISGAKPDLILLFIIFFALFFGTGTGLEAGLILGLLKDIYSADIFGINTITLGLTGLVAGLLSPKLFKESRVTQAFLVFIFTFLAFLMHLFATSVIYRASCISLPEYLYGLIIPSSIYTAAVSVFLYPFLMNRWRLREREEFL